MKKGIKTINPWIGSALLATLFLALSQPALAWRMEPDSIKEPEGTSIQLQIFIETSDWVLADDAAINTCADIGYAASKVARYRLKRIDGSARFTSNPNVKDLHLSSGGQPTLDPTVLYCGAGHYPTLTIDGSHSIHLHNDDEEEPSEQATLELWSIDIEGDEHFETSMSITIDDAAGNTNICQTSTLIEGASAASGSLSESDCDESPAGNGFYSDAYTFSATAGQAFSLLANWAGLDGYLYLAEPGGATVAQNDDFTGSNNSKIEYTPPQSGTYTVWLTTRNPGDAGDYEISLNNTAQPTESYGDWQFTSSEVTPGQLLVGEELSISVSGQRTGTPTVEVPDSVDVIYLLSDDEILTLDDTVIGSENACCSDGFTGAWQGAIEAPVGNYWVGACLDIADDEVSNNCTPATEMIVEAASLCSSQSIECGSVVDTTLTSESCDASPQGPGHYSHSYIFNGVAGDTVWMSASWEFDGYLLLQNPGGQLVAENDNEFNLTNSRIEYTFKEDGPHKLWASSYSPEEGGAYQLTVDCQIPEDGADLVAAAPVIGSSQRVPGELIKVSSEILNAGNQVADSSMVQFKLSSDADIAWADTEMAVTGVESLSPANKATVSASVTAPITPGMYWLGVCVGPGGDEAALSNNCSPATPIEVGSQPICQQQAISCGQSVSGELNKQDCSDSPRGRGYPGELLELDIAQGSSVVLDAAWTGLDGFLVLQGPDGNVVASSDDAGDKLSSRIEYAATESGVHRIWATSARRSKYGSYELELVCGESSAPDLTPLEVSTNASTGVVDSFVDVSARLTNAGGSLSAASQASIMLSTDNKIDPNDVVLKVVDVAELESAGEFSFSESVTLPSSPGNYWVGVCINSVINEALVENNCSGTVAGSVAPLSISSGASCNSSALSCGDSRSGTLGAYDCDLSPRGPGHGSDRFSFSGMAGDTITIDVEWTDLDGVLYLESPSGMIEAENDDFQGSTSRSRIEHVLEESGDYRVWSAAQSEQQTGAYHLDFACNAPVGPDLYIDPPNLERTQIRPGQKLPLTVQVINLGNEATSASRVRYLLSESPSVSYSTNRLLGSSDLRELQPDDSEELSRTLVMNVEPGLYWLGACVADDSLESNIGNNCAYSGPLRVEGNDQPIPITSQLNDAWYNPDTQGQGFFINVFQDKQQMFLSWFTYDLDRPDASVTAQLGDPGHRWLTAFGSFKHGVANLDVMLNQGGVFDQAQPVPEESVYGSMSVSFSDCNTGEIVFDIPSTGEPEIIPITRIASDNLAACEAQRTMGDTYQAEFQPKSNVNPAGFEFNPGLNDAWFNPETEGQGLFFNVFPDKQSLFVSWFTYETERPAADTPFILGEPGHRWLTALGRYDQDIAELNLYKVGGGVFNSADPAPGETEFGSMLVQFDDCGSAQLFYDLPSLPREGLISLQRIAPDSIPNCEAAQPRADAGRLNVTPADKQVLENFCGGSATWSFNWPDSFRASGYEIELWRDDALIPMSFRVNSSEFQYSKNTAIDPSHLKGWKWRYRPVYPAAEQSGEFSPMYTFSVGDCQ